MRAKTQVYPDYSAEIKAINENGITKEVLERIIRRHQPNACYNKRLYDRYQSLDACVPIFNRMPRFQSEKDQAPVINNRVNNDFFGEIIDFKTGYFAGKPIGYSYSSTEESKNMTGGEVAVDEAKKALSDFVTRNNMFDKDMELTKHAAIYGYVGRLFYIDPEGNERCMVVPGYETIILSSTDISEPEYAVRYYSTTDINDRELWHVEFYDNKNIYYYEGALNSLNEIGPTQPHLFDYCPLQAIANNNELIGDAEKVLSLIDAYDRTLSDNTNDIEAFSSAYMIFENVKLDDVEMQKAQHSGAIQFKTGPAGGKVYFLTKEVNDAFCEHHLERLEQNIYRFSKTPNLEDDAFGTASGISLKFKLTGLEAKCGMFQAKMDSAGTYMFKLLASSWKKKKITVDPLQCYMDYSRNFPLDLAGEAAAVQALINAGLPKEIAYDQLSFIDDLDYVMDLIDEQQAGIPSLTEQLPEDEEEVEDRAAEQADVTN